MRRTLTFLAGLAMCFPLVANVSWAYDPSTLTKPLTTQVNKFAIGHWGDLMLKECAGFTCLDLKRNTMKETNTFALGSQLERQFFPSFNRVSNISYMKTANLSIIKKPGSEKINHHRYKKFLLKQFNEKNAKYSLLGADLEKAGRYLRKASKAYALMPTRTLNAITEEENPYLLMGLTLVILPIELTLSRFYGEFSSAYYFGSAGNAIINGSKYMPPQHAPTLKMAGENLKKYRSYGYLSGAVFVGGLAMTTYAWFSALGDNEKTGLLTAGLGAILAGRALRLLPLHYAKSCGKKLESISGSFPTDTHNKLIQEAGKSMQAYANRTYWGYGLQALGITLAFAAGDDDQMKAIGLETAILSWFIFDAVGAKAANSAGERLEELGNVLVQHKGSQGR